MARFSVDGFDDLLNDLAKMSDRVDKASKTSVTLEELFNAEFMEAHTQFSSIEDFFAAGGVKADSWDDLESAPELDAYVASASDFASWSDMLAAADDAFIDRIL